MLFPSRQDIKLTEDAKPVTALFDSAASAQELEANDTVKPGNDNNPPNMFMKHEDKIEVRNGAKEKIDTSRLYHIPKGETMLTDDVKTFMSPARLSSSEAHNHKSADDSVVELQCPPIPFYSVLPERDAVVFPNNSEVASAHQGLYLDPTPAAPSPIVQPRFSGSASPFHTNTSESPSLTLVKVPSVKTEHVEAPMSVIKCEPLTNGDIVKLEFLRSNPDVKVKQEALLNDEGVASRLNAMPGGLDAFPVDLEDEIKMATVTRAWMSKTYGGSLQAGCPSIDTKKFKHGMNDFTYMTYDCNPHAPQMPGAPGLNFGMWRGKDNMGKGQRVIMRTSRSRWLHMGFYDSQSSTPLTKEEWSARPVAFQNHWAGLVSKRKWGLEVCVHVGLRNDLGRDPTMEELRDADVNQYKDISINLIKEAFVSGREHINIRCMRRVGYDEDFQRSLAAMPSDHIPSNRKKQDGKGHVAPKSKKREAGPSLEPEETPIQKRRKSEPSAVDHSSEQRYKRNYRAPRNAVVLVAGREEATRVTTARRKRVASN